MKTIEILGPGCQKCQYVEKVVREVVENAGVNVEIRHVTDYAEIAAWGVLSTPGLVVDGQVVLVGRIPTRQQVEGWLGIG